MDNSRDVGRKRGRRFPGIGTVLLVAARLGVLVFGSWLLVLICAAQDSTSSEIVTVSQLQNLTSEQPEPLRLEGVVLCCDAGWHQLYLNDGKDTAYFNADAFDPLPRRGQRVKITGVAHGNTRLENLNLTVLGLAALPPAKPLEISQLAQDHGQWVQVTGRIMSAETSRGRLALLLHNDRQNCFIYILGESPTNEFKKFLGCMVQVRGINASKTVNGQLDSAMLFVPGLDELSVVDPVDRRPTVQVASISSLLNRPLGPWTNDWVHINGLMIAYQPGQSLVVKDPTGVIQARIIQLTEIPGDERVDVWGFLTVSRDETLLRDAYFEVVQPAADDGDPLSAADPKGGGSGLPENISSMAEVHKLRREEAARHIPVRVHGVLTYADPEWRNGFIQDNSDALYVDLDPGMKELHAGQWVELNRTRTSPGGFAPEVVDAKIQVLGTTNLPTPARVNMDDLANGHWDAHWVEMEGVVRRVDQQSGHVSLSVMTSDGRFHVIIPVRDNKQVPQLVDAVVRIQGACHSELNSLRQLSGITLQTPSFDQVQVLEPPPPDPFAIEKTKIQAVATFDPDRLAGRRVKAEGVVTLRLPGRGFYLQDASGGILVLTQQTNEIHIGDALEVLGFLAIGNFSPLLEQATFRQTTVQFVPAPKWTSAEQVLLHGTNDAQMVELEAQLLQSVPRSAHPQLVLQEGPVIFTATFEAQAGRLEVPALASGSRLRLKGICSIQGGESHEPLTFTLLVSRPEDIQVVQTPPWWTSRHAFMVAGSMAVVVAISLAWAGLLRRQVRNQTEVIRQQLKEAEALEKEILEISNREQRRIGHDLHDGVCQQLAGIALLTSTLADELEASQAGGAARAERISALLNEAIEQTRGVARGLFPVRLEEKGLIPALEELAANASELFKINCRFVSKDPAVNVEKGIALHIYYIVLEAVANASKHGSASNVMINLEPVGNQFRISVQDDGNGFSPPVGGHKGMGIRIMQYRARVIGATFSLQSKPGSGTCVTCQFAPAATGAMPANGDPVNRRAVVSVEKL